MDLFKGDKADIWKYEQGTPDQWVHKQGSFVLYKRNLDCCFQPLSSEDMIKIGVVDLSVPMRYAAFARGLIDDLLDGWTIVNVKEKSVWRVSQPPIVSTHPNGYVAAYLVQDSDIDALIISHYGLT